MIIGNYISIDRVIKEYIRVPTPASGGLRVDGTGSWLQIDGYWQMMGQVGIYGICMGDVWAVQDKYIRAILFETVQDGWMHDVLGILGKSLVAMNRMASTSGVKKNLFYGYALEDCLIYGSKGFNKYVGLKFHGVDYPILLLKYGLDMKVRGIWLFGLDTNGSGEFGMVLKEVIYG